MNDLKITSAYIIFFMSQHSPSQKMKQMLEVLDLITRGSSIEAYLRNMLLIDKRILGSGIGMLYLFCMTGANLWTWETQKQEILGTSWL